MMAKINSIVFDKTGTITESGKSDIIYSGKILNATEQKCIKSLVRNSTHPLSKKIFDSLEGTEFYPVTKFTEPAGKGIEGIVYGNYIKIGSIGFCWIKRLIRIMIMLKPEFIFQSIMKLLVILLFQIHTARELILK